jgi:hypothetical protein
MTRPASLFERLLLRAKLADYAFLVTVAVVIGCLGGFGAVFFRKLIGWVQRVAWGGLDPEPGPGPLPPLVVGGGWCWRRPPAAW